MTKSLKSKENKTWYCKKHQATIYVDKCYDCVTESKLIHKIRDYVIDTNRWGDVSTNNLLTFLDRLEKGEK